MGENQEKGGSAVKKINSLNSFPTVSQTFTVDFSDVGYFSADWKTLKSYSYDWLQWKRLLIHAIVGNLHRYLY